MSLTNRPLQGRFFGGLPKIYRRIIKMTKETEIGVVQEFVTKTDLVSAVVSNWTQIEAKAGNMLPRSAGEIKQEIEAGLGLISFNEGVPISYCRVLPWQPDLLEVGSLVVDPQKRHQGFGLKAMSGLLTMVAEEFPGARIFCLSENEISLKLLKKIGAVEMEKSVLPNVVWELCFKPGAECAHNQQFPNCTCKALDLTNLAKGYYPELVEGLLS